MQDSYVKENLKMILLDLLDYWLLKEFHNLF